MKRIDKVGLRENLDRLGVAWARLGPEDEGVRSKMQEEIFCMACELYYNCTDEITTVFLNDWPKFDPEKGSLSGFFAARINWRGKDTNRWNRSERQVWETDPVTGKKKRVYRSAIVQEGDSSEVGVSRVLIVKMAVVLFRMLSKPTAGRKAEATSPQGHRMTLKEGYGLMRLPTN